MRNMRERCGWGCVLAAVVALALGDGAFGLAVGAAALLAQAALALLAAACGGGDDGGQTSSIRTQKGLAVAAASGQLGADHVLRRVEAERRGRQTLLQLPNELLIATGQHRGGGQPRRNLAGE